MNLSIYIVYAPFPLKVIAITLKDKLINSTKIASITNACVNLTILHNLLLEHVG